MAFSDKAKRFGIRAVVMGELASELRMSAMTLYKHFASKDELVSAMVDEWTLELAAIDALDWVKVDSCSSALEVLLTWANAWTGSLGKVAPAFFSDLQRDHPAAWERFNALISERKQEAYATFVRPLGRAERDQFYADGIAAARLYGALGASASVAELEAQFEEMRPRLERSEILFEFLEIMQRTAIFPRPLRPIQSMLIRAAVENTPSSVREILGLDAGYGLRPWEARFLRVLGRLSDRIVIPSTPVAQACKRLWLSARTLYRRG